MNEHTPPNSALDLPTTPSKRSDLYKLIDALWIVVLTLYIFAGVASVPFHGDEAMQITMSRDAFTAFVNHQPQALFVHSPYTVDSPNWLRLINGSVNIYALGLSLQAAGYGESDLPTLWQWPLSYDENVVRGHRPAQDMLVVSRISSTVFLAMSVVVLFGIGWQMQGRLVAYVGSGLYALSPVILLNGRRAMMEGSVLCFGLLTIWLAILICKGRCEWRWWLALGVAGGLTMASKHSGIVFVVGALGWLIVWMLFKRSLKRQNAQRQPEDSRKDSGKQRISYKYYPLIAVSVSVVVILGVFIALSPALWNDPVTRLGDVVSERQQLLESQVKAEPSAPTSFGERLAGIVSQPYIQAPVYFEAAFWANAAAIQAEISEYDGSLWSGFHAGNVIGSVLTLLAALGAWVTVHEWRTWRVGLLVWLAVTVGTLLINPLPWQRYYLSLYPMAALLSAMGMSELVGWWDQRRAST